MEFAKKPIAQFEPFKTYDELREQCRKSKKDGICDYPIQWVAGAGLEQLPGNPRAA